MSAAFMSSTYGGLNCLMFLVLLFTSACQTTVYERGKFVADPESRIALVAGDPKPGSLKNRDLHLAYQYTYQPDTIRFTGTIKLTGRLSGNFEIVRFFFLTVNFLDEEGRLLKRDRIFYTAQGDLIDVTWRFDKQLVPPAGTTAIAFSYTGEVREGERDGMLGFTGVEPFALNPLRRVPSP